MTYCIARTLSPGCAPSVTWLISHIAHRSIHATLSNTKAWHVRACCTPLLCAWHDVFTCGICPLFMCALQFYDTGWRRLIGCLKSQVIFRKRATNYRAPLRKMTYEDKAFYDATPPCIGEMTLSCVWHDPLEGCAWHYIICTTLLIRVCHVTTCWEFWIIHDVHTEQIYMDASIHVYMNVCIYTFPLSAACLMQSKSYMNSQTHTYTYTHTHTHTHAHARTHEQLHRHTHTHARAHTNMETLRYTDKQTHRHTDTRRKTNTHTYSLYVCIEDDLWRQNDW